MCMCPSYSATPATTTFGHWQGSQRKALPRQTQRRRWWRYGTRYKRCAVSILHE